MSPLLTLGLSLFLAYPVGNLCARFSIPRVTGYLMTGVVLGPSVLASFAGDLPAFLRPLALTPEAATSLSGLKEVAQALILFAIGVGLTGDRFRTAGRRPFALSAIEIGLTFLLSTLAVFVVTGLADLRISLILGAMAIATAPAATMLVIRELESDGPTTRRLLLLVGLDNVASILVFAVLFGALYLGSPVAALSGLGLAAAVGVAVGLALSAVLFQIATEKSFAVLGVGAVLTAWGAARLLECDPLLACLAAGAVLANASPHADAVLTRLRQLDYPLYVAFFLLAGADLHLELLVDLTPIPGMGGAAVALLALAYVVGRSLGKILAGPLAARIAGASDRGEARTGLGLLAQAGLAIALADTVARSGIEHAAAIRAVVLSAVCVFEILGPICVRHVVVHSGEVMLLNLLPERRRESMAQGVADALSRLRRTLHLPGLRHLDDPASIHAADLMRRNFHPIRADMSFEDIVHTFAQESWDQYPVVDEQERFLGVISFPDIRTILFEDVLEEVVISADLITGPGVTCGPDTALPEIIAIFEGCKGEFSHLPVVEAGEPGRVVGMVSQRDAMVFFRRHR